MAEKFGFDAKILSNDELFNKQIELISKKTLAHRMGRADAVNQLDLFIQAIDMERRERMFLDTWKAQPSSPVLLETDPQLAERDVAQEEIRAPKITQPGRPSRRPIRSASPVLPTDGV